MSSGAPAAVTMENCGLNFVTLEDGTQVVNDAGIRLELQGAQLWRMFYELGTEMIITKVGRRMFPAIRVKVSGLQPEKRYFMALDIMPVDENRYRYVYHSSKWMVAGTGDSPLQQKKSEEEKILRKNHQNDQFKQNLAQNSLLETKCVCCVSWVSILLYHRGPLFTPNHRVPAISGCGRWSPSIS